MNLKNWILLTVVQLITVPLFSQYFQKLYDIDSTVDWGYDIFTEPDSTYFIFGMDINSHGDPWALFNLHISADGNTVISKKTLQSDSASLFIGVYGEMRMLPVGGYVAPFTAEIAYGTFTRGWGGILKYNATGDTTFLKTYTDTSVYYDAFDALSIMPDNGYIIGGGHGLNTPSNYSGYIIRTDSIGDTLWTNTYQYDTGQPVGIINVIALPDGKIAAAALSQYWAYAGPPSHLPYLHYTPWFLLIDSHGNIIRDTLYTAGYLVGGNCGELYPDMDGGYINIGQYDSLYTSDPSDLQNFPGYIAHLDTNFRITWITSFPYDSLTGHRQPVIVRQLRDSTYIVVGDNYWNYPPGGNLGWAAKISHAGIIEWSRTFINDNMRDSYLRDMAEKPDGNYIFTGSSYTRPNWRGQDVWLLGVDSNGCEIEGCNQNTVVKKIIKPNGTSISLFPNPTTGEFTLKCPQSGTVILYNMQGQQVMENKVMAGATILWLPGGVGAGVYMVKYVGEGGGVPVVLRLVYEP